MKKILTNKAMCRVCSDIIESKHRHDFVFCKCGAIAVDGGKEYLKRMGEFHHIADMSKYAQCECGTDIEYLSVYSQPEHPLNQQYKNDSMYWGMWYCPKCNKEYK